MDFFARQDRARRNTSVLVTYFLAAVVSIVVALNLVGMIALNANRYYQSVNPRNRRGPVAEPVPIAWWDSGVVFCVTAGTLVVIIGGSLYKIGQLAGGGRAVAEMMGAIPVPPNTSDPQQRVLRNVVEEMSIASGVPAPAVYLLPNENGINAFAAGFTTRDAVICVTQGCLTRLTRDELQGVIAHEFSHILNGDIALDLRLIGVLYGILLIGLIGYGILRSVGTTSSRSDRDSGGGQLAILAIGALVAAVGFIGLFFGRLIQAAVCRQRELLADAAAVQFTRNPEGLAGALKKLGSLGSGSRVSNSDAEQMAHLFFAASSGIEFGWFATHPPLAQRIKAIEPSWDGKFPPRPGPTTLERYSEGQTDREALAMGLPMAAAGIVAAVGAPMPGHIAWASDFLTSVPPLINNAAREPFSARALVFALLLSDDEAVRQKQMELLGSQTDATTVQLVQKLSGPVDQLGARARRVLLDLALPALRQLSGPQCTQFHQTVQSLTDTDGTVSLFEYMLRRILAKYLPPPGAPPAAAQMTYYSIKPLLPDIEVILSALAAADGKDAAAVASALKAGAARIDPGAPLNLQHPVTLEAVDAAIDRIAPAAPGVKRRIVDACAYCVAADGLVQTEEGELLRAITTAWDCPLPPLLAQHAPLAQTA
jgi:Zn-dependent protease with chaperone function